MLEKMRETVRTIAKNQVLENDLLRHRIMDENRTNWKSSLDECIINILEMYSTQDEESMPLLRCYARGIFSAFRIIANFQDYDYLRLKEQEIIKILGGEI